MSVIITSLHRFEADFKLHNPDSVISIVNPEMEHPVVNNNVPTLKMKFHDICFEIHNNDKYTLPSIEDVDEIFHFGAVKYKKDTRLLVHCFAGISRSSAAAIIALCPHYGYKDAVKMVAEVDVYMSKGLYEKGSSWFMPNNLMIKYADKRLCLDGDLIKLVNEVFSY